MTSTSVIARLTLQEAARRWVLWAALILGVIFLVVFSLGFNEIQKEMARSTTQSLQRNQIYNFMMLAGLYAVNFLTLVMAVLTSVDTLSGEIASGTIHILVSKPMRRWEIVLGKWFGYSAMLSVYLLLMGGGVVLAVYLIAGYAAPHIPQGLGLMWLNIELMLTISLLGGTTLSTLANGVMAFGLYSIAFIGGWVEQFGSFLQNQTAVKIGVISSLIIPSEALWKRAVYEMQSPLVAALGFSPFSAASTPSAAMIAYAVLYLLAAFVLALRLFNRRDL
jgi:Cu-processing system permease protein